MIVTVAYALSPISVSASWPGELFGTRVGHHLRLDGNLHEAGCPTALKPAATLAGVIVRGDVQHVVARLAERDVRRCLSAEGRGTAPRRRQLLDHRLRLIERHCPGPA